MFVDYDSRQFAVDKMQVATVARQNSNYQANFKRLFDIAFSFGALFFIAPILILVAIAIKLESRGPIFFRQTRNGINGTTFQIYKFRSMRHAPEQQFAQATKGDGRITKLGALLRKTSIDELPQLLNVLKGEMSIVGPRPHPVKLDELYASSLANYMKRYDVKPGLTGLAQILGHRGPTPTAEIMKMRLDADLEYASVVTLAKDINILVLTVPAVFALKNAH
jgi:lipopolysaccharide/colanic/teichoic acid biosynthesis glycosyltransferase